MHSFYIIYLLGYSLPFSLLLGVLLSMGRLIGDNEIVAVHVAGISTYRILGIFVVLGTIFTLALFLINDMIVPSMHFKYRAQKKNMLFKNIDTLIEPGVFIEHFPNYILYIGDKEANKLKNVFIYEVEKNNRQTKVTFAKRGEFVTEDNLLKLKLEDGFRDETSPNNKNELYRLNFKIFFIDMPIGSNSKVSIDKKPSDMTIKELMDKMNHLKKMGVNTVELGKEMHKRLSFSFSIISFIILGFALSLSVRHKEKSVNMGLAFVAVFFGYLLFILAEAIVEYQIIIPSIGMWLPNVIILGIAIFLFKKNAHFR
jgi:lipopolysaccharide export system permease protein